MQTDITLRGREADCTPNSCFYSITLIVMHRLHRINDVNK